MDEACSGGRVSSVKTRATAAAATLTVTRGRSSSLVVDRSDDARATNNHRRTAVVSRQITRTHKSRGRRVPVGVSTVVRKVKNPSLERFCDVPPSINDIPKTVDPHNPSSVKDDAFYPWFFHILNGEIYQSRRSCENPVNSRLLRFIAYKTQNGLRPRPRHQ